MLLSKYVVLPVLAICAAFVVATQSQKYLLYDSGKGPVRMEVTESGKQIQVVNYSDLEVKQLALGCVTEPHDGKVTVETKIESLEYFDLKRMSLRPAGRKNQLFSLFGFSTEESSVRGCRALGLKIAVVEVVFTDGSSWKIPQL
jgi:hypothetical protein